MRRLIPLLALGLSMTTACTNDSTSPTGSIVGTWSLRTINGSNLPYAVGTNAVITSERLTLNNDGSYMDVAQYANGNSFTEYGYYSQNNNAITFSDQTDNITYSGSISGNVLTEINNQFTSTYQKD